jgi:hypothetical protein
MARKTYTAIDAAGNKVTSVATGTAATDAVNKGQLDAAIIDEVLVANNQPTPVVGLDLWIDADAPASAVAADHGGLTGLLDDDHTQYHNDARGDARYRRQSVTIAHSTLTGLTSDDHTQYLTNARGDARYMPLLAQFDHGNLSGLADDDHPFYSLASGARAFTGQVVAPSLMLSHALARITLDVPGQAASILRQTASGPEFRNLADTAYQTVSAASPTTGQHLATKGYVDTRIWFGTLAQYNAVSPKDAAVLYVVTG